MDKTHCNNNRGILFLPYGICRMLSHFDDLCRMMNRNRELFPALFTLQHLADLRLITDQHNLTIKLFSGAHRSEYNLLRSKVTAHSVNCNLHQETPSCNNTGALHPHPRIKLFKHMIDLLHN